MVKGPKGEKRPADVNACAVTIAQIATGEIEEKLPSDRRKGGQRGGKARAKKLTSEQRQEIAKKAANARWS